MKTKLLLIYILYSTFAENILVERENGELERPAGAEHPRLLIGPEKGMGLIYRSKISLRSSRDLRNHPINLPEFDWLSQIY